MLVSEYLCYDFFATCKYASQYFSVCMFSCITVYSVSILSVMLCCVAFLFFLKLSMALLAVTLACHLL